MAGVDGVARCAEGGSMGRMVIAAAVGIGFALGVGCGEEVRPEVSLLDAATGCVVDGDCATAEAPRCDVPTAACVGCLGDADCGEAAPVCGGAERACRGCERDAECGGAVCLVGAGRCAARDAIAYAQRGGSDDGACTEEAPCATVGYAVAQARARGVQVVLLAGADIDAGDLTVRLFDGLVLQGDRTALRSAADPVVEADAAGTSWISGIAIEPPGVERALVVRDAQVRGRSVQLAGAVEVTLGAVELEDSTIRGTSLACDTGRLRVADSTLDRATIRATSCGLEVARSTFHDVEPGVTAVRVEGLAGATQIENAIFSGARAFTALAVGSGASGVAFRFNTVVNTLAAGSSVPAVSCAGPASAATLTSNVFATASYTPLEGCTARWSVFDAPGAVAAKAGTSNISVDVATIFGVDFELAPGSRALGRGEPGLVDRDRRGRARPMPAGSRADAGALESPN